MGTNPAETSSPLASTVVSGYVLGMSEPQSDFQVRECVRCGLAAFYDFTGSACVVICPRHGIYEFVDDSGRGLDQPTKGGDAL